VSPFNHPLDIHRSEMLQEFSECSRFHLFVFELVIPIMLWLVLIEWNERMMNQLEFLIQPYLRERKRKHG